MALLLVGMAILFVACVRVRLAGAPFERDEGEYAYAGQLILRGIPPYLHAYNMKFPGSYYAYALAMALFGQTVRGVRLALLLVNAATTVLVFAIGRRLLGGLAGAIAAIAFALLSLDPAVLGLFGHASHFVLLPALAGLLLLLRAPRHRRAAWIVAAGVLLGLALLVKQHAFTFVLVGGMLAGWPEAGAGRRGARAIGGDVALLAVASALPFAVLVALLHAQGVLGAFWFWTIRYAREYVSEVPLGRFLPNLGLGLGAVTSTAWPLWLIAGAGLAALWAGRAGTRDKAFLTGLLAASFVSVCPGLYFRRHYFILMLPALALLAGAAFGGARRALARRVPDGLAATLAAAGFGVAALATIAPRADLLFTMTPRQMVRACYGSNPFIEAVEIGDYIREHTAPEERIAVLGSEPEIYFYAHRLSATGHLYAYPLMEPQPYAAQMQDAMIREIEAARPRYVVFVGTDPSWLAQPASSRKILDWANRYTSRCDELVGIADPVSPDETRYVWDEQAPRYRPRSSDAVYVFRRRADAPCDTGP